MRRRQNGGAPGGTVGTLVNSGVISGNNFAGLYNAGSIGALTNSGTILGQDGI